MQPTDFDPPLPDGSDTREALLAKAEARGALERVRPPICHGYANCCRCPVCQLGPRCRHPIRKPTKERIAA
jgi:hypothetical protein